jgi:hypothetical protein
MAERDRERQMADARLAYVAAVRRLDTAMRRFAASGIAMHPGTGPEPVPWSREQIRSIQAVAHGFREVIDRRRAWDGLRQEWRPGD